MKVGRYSRKLPPACRDRRSGSVYHQGPLKYGMPWDWGMGLSHQSIEARRLFRRLFFTLLMAKKIIPIVSWSSKKLRTCAIVVSRGVPIIRNTTL